MIYACEILSKQANIAQLSLKIPTQGEGALALVCLTLRLKGRLGTSDHELFVYIFVKENYRFQEANFGELLCVARTPIENSLSVQ